MNRRANLLFWYGYVPIIWDFFIIEDSNELYSETFIQSLSTTRCFSRSSCVFMNFVHTSPFAFQKKKEKTEIEKPALGKRLAVCAYCDNNLSLSIVLTRPDT